MTVGINGSIVCFLILSGVFVIASAITKQKGHQTVDKTLHFMSGLFFAFGIIAISVHI